MRPGRGSETLTEMEPPERDTRTRVSGLRASDADRERVAERLREHYGEGRLSDYDLSERIDAAYRARTISELEALTVDLPSTQGPGHRRPRSALETSVRIHLTTYLLVNLLLIGIWAASGGGYFWPIWPILGWGIGVGCHAAPLLAGRGASPRGQRPAIQPERQRKHHRAIEPGRERRRRPRPAVEPAESAEPSSVDEVASTVD